MAISIGAYVGAITLALPKAYIDVDQKTDNILVYDGKRGFVITRQSIDNYGISGVVRKAQKAFSDMAAGLDGSDDGLKFYTAEELDKQRDGPTAFDEAS